jgi:hypothetical protein
MVSALWARQRIRQRSVAPTREMDGDVGGRLDSVRQYLHDLAEYLFSLRGRQDETSRDGGE